MGIWSINRFVILAGCLLLTTVAVAQTRIDSTLAFGKNESKKYSLFIPSTFDPFTPTKAVLALHPFNPERWDASSWCDELMGFAETNNLILICPDGDEDGRIDDPVDTAFATVLTDSVKRWYLLDANKIFVMGFSWGGKTTYTYGLSHSNSYAGFIAIGAALNRTDDLGGLFPQANNKPFYIIHGEKDSPDVRFRPVRDSLVLAGAFVRTRLLRDVGHTIGFKRKDEILTDAFHWVDSVHSITTDTNSLKQLDEQAGVQNELANEFRSGRSIPLEILLSSPGELRFRVTDLSGKAYEKKELLLGKGLHTMRIKTNELPWGVYELSLSCPGLRDFRHKFRIRG